MFVRFCSSGRIRPTTLRLTAFPVVAASRCKRNYLHARKTDSRGNWGGLWGDPSPAMCRHGYLADRRKQLIFAALELLSPQSCSRHALDNDVGEPASRMALPIGQAENWRHRGGQIIFIQVAERRGSLWTMSFLKLGSNRISHKHINEIVEAVLVRISSLFCL